MVSLTSWPYAPTFWIGVAPTEPGMPDRHSMPARPSCTALATNGSQGSPACTSSAPSPLRLTPRVRRRTTVPRKPSSAITTLLPPARISTGSPRAPAGAVRGEPGRPPDAARQALDLAHGGRALRHRRAVCGCAGAPPGRDRVPADRGGGTAGRATPGGRDVVDRALRARQPRGH